jgi:hypothetical protein
MQARLSFLVLALCLGTLSSSCLIKIGGPEDQYDRNGRGAASGGLQAALDSVSAENLAADLHFFACDELAGRDSPSSGLRVAARFVRSRLQRLGWEPGAREGYFHTYNLRRKRLDKGASSIAVTRGDTTTELAPGTDYFFFARPLADHTVAGGVTFAGTGTVEDVHGMDLTGRWAWCHSSDDVSRRERSRNVRGTGAIGLIVSPGPDYDGEPFAEAYGSWMERAGISRGASSPGYPTINVGAKAAEGLLAMAGSPELTPGAMLDVNLTETRTFETIEDIELENVCGFLPGNDPVLSEEVIIVSAHYDHVGTSAAGEIFNGADDNGSGSVGLLALAEALNAHGKLRRSVMLIWVSAEEKGLLGSAAWTEDPYFPNGGRAVLDLNIDMIGRNGPEHLLVTPTSEHERYNGIVRIAEAVAPKEGFPELGSADAYWNRSDHANFARNMDIPVAFLFSDVHEDYHQPGDTADKIDYDKATRVVRLVVRMIDKLQAPELNLEIEPEPEPEALPEPEVLPEAEAAETPAPETAEEPAPPEAEAETESSD